MIQKAAEFAARAHEGILRKGIDMPYIVHPKEVATIVAVMTNEPEIIAAAYLHDVIEDTEVTYQRLADEFGKRVADLVQAESEDKTKTWLERKQATVTRLKSAEANEKMIAFGDKLSNLRSTAADYLVMGDRIWNKFHQKDKKMHAWYYWNVFQSFGEFRTYPFYEEYRLLWQLVFGEMS